MQKFIRDPLFHFLIIGLVLFAYFDLFSEAPETNDKAITLTQAEINAVSATFSRMWQRPPSTEELKTLLDEKIREEIAYREAIALGLDTDDAVIRKRLRMKYELLIEDIAGLRTPSDKDLQQYLDENADNFFIPPLLSFYTIFFNPDLREDAEGDAHQTLKRLHADESIDTTELGDRTMLPRYLEQQPAVNIAGMFSDHFAKGIMDLPVGQWAGPIQSGYGYHLILIEEKREGRTAQLDEIRARLEQQWMATMRQSLKAETYERLADQYDITIQLNPEEAGNE